MRIFVFEFIMGGGTWCHPSLGEPSGSLLAEGRAMLSAIVADLAALDGVELTLLLDARTAPSWLADETPDVAARAVASMVNDAESTRHQFQTMVRQADATLLIAPEIDNCLAVWGQLVVDSRGTLLGPGVELLQLASDKRRTLEHLRHLGVPVPASRPWSPGEPWPQIDSPQVAKPLLGAGCYGVKRVATLRQLQQHVAEFPQVTQWQVEAYQPGRAASVSVVCTPNEDWVLPPCWQELSDDLSQYRGARLIDEADLAQRARRLAQRAVVALPARCGYLGFDVVLGEAGDGSDDTIIEINPRLTTSYITLRQSLGLSIAQALVGILPSSTSRP